MREVACRFVPEVPDNRFCGSSLASTDESRTATVVCPTNAPTRKRLPARTNETARGKPQDSNGYSTKS